jgi:hypothetical protein
VWSHLKPSLASLTKQNITQLTALVKTRLKQVQYRPGLLNGFVVSTGLDPTPFCNLRDGGPSGSGGEPMLGEPWCQNTATGEPEVPGLLAVPSARVS